MKRKLFILLFLQNVCMGLLMAQISNPVNITIELSGAGQFISVDNSTVNLVFSTVDDYTHGVHSGDATKDHLTIGSTSGFQVVVKGTGDLSNGDHIIALNCIHIIPTDGSDILGLTPNYFSTSNGLSTTDQTIITSTSGAASAKFDIDYFAKDNSSLLELASEYGSSIYSTTIIYSILPY